MAGVANPWTVWAFPPLVVASALAAAACFAQGWLRLRRRGRPDLAGWGRLGLFAAGLGIVTLAIVSPIDAVGEGYLQVGHMLQHVLLADLGVALVVLSLRGPLAVFFLPRDVLAPLARRRRLRRALGRLQRPRNALFVWLVVLVVWHVPPLYDAALRIRAVHDLQHVSFVAAGVLLWVVLLDPTRHARTGAHARIALAALVLFTGQLLAYVLLFAPRPFYPVYAEQEVRLLGLSPLQDQRLSGALMMTEQLLTVGVFLFWQVRTTVKATGRPRRPTPGPDRRLRSTGGKQTGAQLELPTRDRADEVLDAAAVGVEEGPRG